MRKIAMTAAGLVALFLTISSPARGEAPRSWQEQLTGVSRPFQKIITNQAEFDSAWKSIFRGLPVPVVDFQKEFAACVCLGERRSGGYRVIFEWEFPRAGKLIVPYWEKEPAGLVTEALTQPCAVKIFDRKQGLEPEMQKVKKQEL